MGVQKKVGEKLPDKRKDSIVEIPSLSAKKIAEESWRQAIIGMGKVEKSCETRNDPKAER